VLSSDTESDALVRVERVLMVQGSVRVLYIKDTTRSDEDIECQVNPYEATLAPDRLNPL
jgi:hypothetical protein